MLGSDLRQWIAYLEDTGQLETIHGADWDLEIGGLTGILCRKPNGPVLLFDNVKGYPEGHRVMVNILGSLERFGMVVGLDYNGNKIDFVQQWRQRVKKVELIPPQEVATAPFKENVRCGNDIDLLELPAPKWNALDGGRYLSTGGFAITRDPDEGWVNIGTYRGMIMDKDVLGLDMEPGQHGRLHSQKYFAQGKPCPVAVVIGGDPLLFLCGSLKVPEGASEYDFAGGLRGVPIEVVVGEATGLPLPRSAEIVVEGEMIAGDERMEGPFGEWTGYYASGAKMSQAIQVKKVMYRNNPIILGHPPYRPPSSYTVWRAVIVSAGLWNDIEAAGVPGVCGVWAHEASGAHLFNVVSIKQRYSGHPRQAALIASQCGWGFLRGRFIVVVDDDIDPTNLEDVIWAVGTRSDPERSIHIVNRTAGTPLDPAIPTGQRGLDSRAIIDACRPFEWIKDFAPVCAVGKDLAEELAKKWQPLLGKYSR